MRVFVPTLARWLHAIALSLWLGGLIAIGALVAPMAFRTLRGSEFLTQAQATTLAGHIVGDSLHLFNILCYVCAALLLLANLLLLGHSDRRWIFASLVTTSLLLVSALVLGAWLTPALDTARQSGDMRTFDHLHHLYEQISSLVQMPLLLLLAWFGALRDGSR